LVSELTIRAVREESRFRGSPLTCNLAQNGVSSDLAAWGAPVAVDPAAEQAQLLRYDFGSVTEAGSILCLVLASA
jgi:hypothetical protein